MRIVERSKVCGVLVMSFFCGLQGEAIETQTTKVSKLRREVEAGKSRMEALEKERARLVAMEVILTSLGLAMPVM